MSAKIGSLNVDLTLETARFQNNLKQTQSSFGKAQKQMVGIARGMAVAFAGVGFAVAGIDRAFGNLSAKAKDLNNAANLAGAGFEDFQRKAQAASTVGVEFQKLGDIYKDVQDKIGDFTATGGGEMKAFFDNIAPKVNLTAEAFKGLGGPEALQLYFNSLQKAGVSSQELVFYMESLGDEGSALIPLLKENGKAFDELGSKTAIIDEDQLAKLKRYENGQIAIENAMQRVTLAMVDSGAIDAFADLAEKLSVVTEGFTGVEAAADATEEELARTEGPRKFGQDLRTMSDEIQGYFDAAHNGAAEFGKGVRRNIDQAWAGFERFHGQLQSWGDGIRTTFSSMATAVIDYMARMVRGVSTWISDRLGAVWNGVKAKVYQVKGYFFDLYDAVVGHSYIPDMVDGIAQHMARLDQVMVDKAQATTQATGAAFRSLAFDVQQIMGRLFPEAAKLKALRDDLGLIDRAGANGLLSQEQAALARYQLGREYRGATGDVPVAATAQGPLVIAEDVEAASERLARSLGLLGSETRVQTVRIAQSFQDMANKTISALDGMVNAIKGGGFLDILGSAVSLFLQIGSTGALGKGLAANINAPRIPAYAGGTNFHPGGLALVGERGPELVNLDRGSQVFSNSASNRMLGGGTQVEVILRDSMLQAQITRGAGRVVEAASPLIMDGSANVAFARAGRRNSRRL